MSFKVGFQHQLGAFAANVTIKLAVMALNKAAVKIEDILGDSSSDENKVEEHIEEHIEENPQNNTISRETLESIADMFMDLDAVDIEEEEK